VAFRHLVQFIVNQQNQTIGRFRIALIPGHEQLGDFFEGFHDK
jgi:hypothetical protein